MGILLATGLSPAGATVKTGTINDIDCNATSVKTGVSLVQGHSGTFKIKQNSATDDRRTDWTARSSNGNDLGYKHTSTGDTVTWNGVLPSTYTVRARKYVPSDCSPLNPFSDGSYDVTYTATSTN
ncbi:hypothetical protein EFK50_19900 [Nocardioides marmoriginsengisoli]|uniref:Uncharacterized protein n=2 Tax=Nocardioides marmoriginsengisoli TaxID=661483 RepID=A0A3N0CAS6_9ACTN|nr:hypothetical protein EFK50_19900 [Nocardioides marmoriginsengisoli]